MNSVKFIIIGLVILFALLLFAAAAKVMFFPAMVANTAINSAEGVIKKTLDSTNVLHNYEWFYDTNAAIESRVAQVSSHKDILAGTTDVPERSVLNMELAAMKQSCRELTTKYNANSEKANRSLFKSNGLPESFDISICEGK